MRYDSKKSSDFLFKMLFDIIMILYESKNIHAKSIKQSWRLCTFATVLAQHHLKKNLKSYNYLFFLFLSATLWSQTTETREQENDTTVAEYYFVEGDSIARSAIFLDDVRDD